VKYGIQGEKVWKDANYPCDTFSGYTQTIFSGMLKSKGNAVFLFKKETFLLFFSKKYY